MVINAVSDILITVQQREEITPVIQITADPFLPLDVLFDLITWRVKDKSFFIYREDYNMLTPRGPSDKTCIISSLNEIPQGSLNNQFGFQTAKPVNYQAWVHASVQFQQIHICIYVRSEFYWGQSATFTADEVPEDSIDSYLPLAQRYPQLSNKQLRVWHERLMTGCKFTSSLSTRRTRSEDVAIVIGYFMSGPGYKCSEIICDQSNGLKSLRATVVWGGGGGPCRTRTQLARDRPPISLSMSGTSPARRMPHDYNCNRPPFNVVRVCRGPRYRKLSAETDLTTHFPAPAPPLITAVFMTDGPPRRACVRVTVGYGFTSHKRDIAHTRIPNPRINSRLRLRSQVMSDECGGPAYSAINTSYTLNLHTTTLNTASSRVLPGTSSLQSSRSHIKIGTSECTPWYLLSAIFTFTHQDRGETSECTPWHLHSAILTFTHHDRGLVTVSITLKSTNSHTDIGAVVPPLCNLHVTVTITLQSTHSHSDIGVYSLAPPLCNLHVHTSRSGHIGVYSLVPPLCNLQVHTPRSKRSNFNNSAFYTFTHRSECKRRYLFSGIFTFTYQVRGSVPVSLTFQSSYSYTDIEEYSLVSPLCHLPVQKREDIFTPF
ncbi:hypothetical protein J6590_018696 [Homalodisca vitripennis]|nr:hypothetical protein J6590_018696 [Homalodisca vitripennis]